MMSSTTLVKVKSSYKIKVLVVGSAGSGKHTFCSKYSYNFSRKFRDIIGVDIYVSEQTNSDGETSTLSCWNCAPQERFYFYHNKFFRGALGALVLFDVTKRESFEQATYWIQEIRKNVNGIPIVLIGNKVDLLSERVISYEEAFNLVESKSLAAFIETSAKKDLNILDTFRVINELTQNYAKSTTQDFEFRKLNPKLRSKIEGFRLDGSN